MAVKNARSISDALRKAEIFVASLLTERNGRRPDAQTVRKVAQRVVKAMPQYEHNERASGS